MGKRELVLIALFAAIGIVVYQFTAPPPPPGSEGVSVGGIFQKLKRGVRGAHEVATADSRQTTPVDADVRLVRINFPRSSDITITGSDRADIAVELHASARGFDQAEAKAAADAAKLTLERAGDAVVIGAALPSGRGGPGSGFVNQATVTIALPRRLLVRIEPHVGQLIVRDVAGLEAMGSRGETRVIGSAGHVILTHSGGPLEVDGVPSLKLTARNSHGSIKHVAGTLSLDATGAELDLEDIAGPLDVEARNTEMEIDAAKTVKVPIRFNGTGGRLRVKNLRAEARVDGRNVELDLSMAAAAPVTIYSTGEDIAVNAPPGGYTLDAVATEGRVSIDDGALKPPDDGEQRVTGPVRGGGAALTLRATRADIHVRKPEGK
jgi:hypothetical protein